MVQTVDAPILVAQAGELAVDASVSPRRILGGQARDEGA
jgi:hypothetical protein